MRRHAATTLLLFTTLVLGGCDKFTAREHFHRANNHYKEENFQAALHDVQRGLQLDPNAKEEWRSVGFSALALYRPGDDSAKNKGYAATAVDAFKQYLTVNPEDQKVHEYLVSVLMASDRKDEAIQLLQEDAAKHPNDPKYQTSVINAMAEAGELDKAYARAEATHTADPQIYHAIGVTAWSKSYRNPPADVVQHRALIDLGIKSLEKALQLEGAKPSFETLTYINLIWREKVKVEVDPFKQQDYIKKADEYRKQAMDLRAQQKAQQNQAPPATTPSPAAPGAKAG